MIEYTKTRYNDEFCYYAADEIIGASLREYGEYSQIEVDLLLSILTENSVVYDVGGNIGYHTVAFASKAKKVYTFEPNFRTYSLLIRNVSQYPNVYPMNFAAGDELKVLRCIDYDPAIPANFGAVQLANENAEYCSLGDKYTIKTLSVPVVPIDSLALDLPDLIKIDVEKHELAVIKGCLNIIKQRPPVIFYEAHETPDFAEIYNLLKSLDFNLYWVPSPNYNPNNYKNNKEIMPAFKNTALFSVIAVHASLSQPRLVLVNGPDDSFQRVIDEGLCQVAKEEPEKKSKKKTSKRKVSKKE